MIIDVICPICHEHDVIEVDADAYVKWLNKELLIQEAFPNMEPSVREQLITGICPSCWEEMFGEK